VRGCDLGQRADAVGLSERKDEFIKRKKTIERRVTILCNSCHRDRTDTKLVPGAIGTGLSIGSFSRRKKFKDLAHEWKPHERSSTRRP